jgi:hypothetical protein
MTAPTTLHEHGKKCRHREYYLTCDAFDMLLALAGDACQICGKGSRSTLVIDHDHECFSKVRGLLCPGCNVRMGRVDGGHRATSAELAYASDPFHARLTEQHYTKADRGAKLANTKIRLRASLIAQIHEIAKAEDRSAGSAARILIAEALRAREEKEKGK